MLSSLDGLRVFHRVAAGLSISGAAGALHYSRSQAARLVRSLERDLGGPLLARTPSGSHLTPRGIDVVAWSCAVLCGARHLTSPDGRPAPGTVQCVAEPDLPCVGIATCPGRPPHRYGR